MQLRKKRRPWRGRSRAVHSYNFANLYLPVSWGWVAASLGASLGSGAIDCSAIGRRSVIGLRGCPRPFWPLRPIRPGRRFANPRSAANVLPPFSISSLELFCFAASLDPRLPFEYRGLANPTLPGKRAPSEPMDSVYLPEEKCDSTSLHPGGCRGAAAPQTPPSGAP